MRRSSLHLAGVLVSACILMLVVRLAEVQSAAGTAYPAYSSLRADARGLKVLFDVVEAVGRRAERNYFPLSEIEVKDTTVVKLGLSPGTLVAAALPGPSNAAMLAAHGNTVVLGLAGECHSAIVKEWQLTLQCEEDGQYFAGGAWTVLESDTEHHALAIERKFGAGEIVLLADSRMLSNGALARRPRAALAGMLAERRSIVLFDEEHLGVTDTSSVGKLLRRYRLHGVMLAGMLLFGLFVWRNTSSFLPRVEAPVDEIVGRDTTAGLANLLRRSVPPARLLSVTIAEWAKATRDPDREREIRRIAALHANPAEGYNAVARALHQKRNLV